MIIIRDETMNESYTFVTTEQGYRDAYATIRSIESKGHVVGGDVGKVMAFIY